MRPMIMQYKQVSSASFYIGLLIVMGLLLDDASSFLFHQRGHHRLSLGTTNPIALNRNAFPCYGTVVAYTPSSTVPTSAATNNAPQTSSTAAYLDSLSTISQSTPTLHENSQAAAQSPPPSVVPMDTPARQSLPAHLSLHPFPNKGLGVITTIPISKGEFIGDYKGEIFTEQVKDRRYLPSQPKTIEDEEWIQSRVERGQSLTGCYVYGITIPPTKSNNFETNQRIYVDAEDEYKSLWTRFLNHASPPNNNCNPKSVHESYDGEPRVWFVACRDIEVGEELCFDYGDDYWLEGDDVV
mmetsp:Transcript_13409/g.22042  ORF Transcript_13409/g.22042 Transcript_13409/m.22042 type:complete len:297 (-) Transcript_13409:275-1165(-)